MVPSAQRSSCAKTLRFGATARVRRPGGSVACLTAPVDAIADPADVGPPVLADFPMAVGPPEVHALPAELDPPAPPEHAPPVAIVPPEPIAPGVSDPAFPIPNLNLGDRTPGHRNRRHSRIYHPVRAYYKRKGFDHKQACELASEHAAFVLQTLDEADAMDEEYVPED